MASKTRWHFAPADTWPDLRVTVHPLPWCWRLRPRFYADDVDGGFWGHSSFEWLCIRLEWWNNRPMFIERRGRVRLLNRPTTVVDDDIVTAPVTANPGCPHGRPSWAMCPHCLGVNNRTKAT